MRRGRVVIAVILILVVGAALLFFVLRMMFNTNTTQSPAVPTPNMVSIIVVAQSIPQGAKIEENMLDTMAIPQDKLTSFEYSADRMGEVVGKYARLALEPGMPITTSMLAESATDIVSTGPQWVSVIPQGQTAISIPVSRLSAVAYGVADGSHVNVIACMLFIDVDSNYQTALPNFTGLVTGPGFMQGSLPVLTSNISGAGGTAGVKQGRVELEPSLQQPVFVFPSEEQRPRQVCQMIIQDTVVMKLGNFSLNPTTAATSGDAAATAQPAPETVDTRPPDIITLVLSPQDAITLTYLVYNGSRLTLTLRGAGDQSRIATEAATLQYILSQYNIPIPAKLPYTVQPRIDLLSQPIMPNDAVEVPAQ
jgi:pilus assembly protein CpaB